MTSRFASGVVAAGLLLAACSGAISGSMPIAGYDPNAASRVATPYRALASHAHRTSFMRHVDAKQRLVYVSDPGNQQVIVFDDRGTMVGDLTYQDYPNGMFVDASHNLWVAQAGLQPGWGGINEFRRGGTTAIQTLRAPNTQPFDVTICPDGTIYVSNWHNFWSSTGSISVYPRGRTIFTRVLQYPGQGSNYFLTCDAKGNVFTTLYLSNSPYSAGVVEYPSGRQTGAHSLNISLGWPGGIKPDKAGNLLVDDQYINTVCEYTEAGSPTGNCIENGFSGEWSGIAVNRANNVVIGADPANRNAVSKTFPGGVTRQVYSAQGSVPISSPSGAAFDPGQAGI